MFDLNHKLAKMGVINNRIEYHGDREVTAFDIPLTILLDPTEFCDAVGDKHVHNMLFDKKGEVVTPAFPQLTGYKLAHDLQGASVVLHIGSTFEAEYEDVEITAPKFELLHGGEISTEIKLQVNPQTKHITRLLDAQNTEVYVTISDAEIAEKKKQKQRELPLGADPRADEAAGTTTPLSGAHLAGAGADADTTLIWWHNPKTNENRPGKRSEMPEGCVEIDPPTGSESEKQQIAADAQKRGTEDDNEAFAEGVARAVGAHVNRDTGAIDGTSEASRNQQRRRRGHSDSAH